MAPWQAGGNQRCTGIGHRVIFATEPEHRLGWYPVVSGCWRLILRYDAHSIAGAYHRMDLRTAPYTTSWPAPVLAEQPPRPSKQRHGTRASAENTSQWMPVGDWPSGGLAPSARRRGWAFAAPWGHVVDECPITSATERTFQPGFWRHRVSNP